MMMIIASRPIPNNDDNGDGNVDTLSSHTRILCTYTHCIIIIIIIYRAADDDIIIIIVPIPKSAVSCERTVRGEVNFLGTTCNGNINGAGRQVKVGTPRAAMKRQYNTIIYITGVSSHENQNVITAIKMIFIVDRSKRCGPRRIIVYSSHYT